MSLDQLKGTEITIQKGEGITQAIDRVAKEKNIEITKSELLDLAVQVSKETQFKGRKITQYSVGGKKYDAVSLVHVGEKFKIQGNAPVASAPATPTSGVKPAPAAVVPTGSQVRDPKGAYRGDRTETTPTHVAPSVAVNKPASVSATPASASPVSTSSQVQQVAPASSAQKTPPVSPTPVQTPLVPPASAKPAPRDNGKDA